MQTQLGDAPLKMQRKNSLSPQSPQGMQKRSLDNDEIDREDGDDQSVGSTSNQLVLYTPDQLLLYTPDAGSTSQDVHDYVENRASPIGSYVENHASSAGRSLAPIPSRVMPSVGTFTVQCAACFKWRLIPKKEKYEEIRERILQEPFVCEQAREWRPDISCDDPADISQDGSRVWAIDKPNIAQPPPGWERLLRFRGEGSTKFADVYYVAPSGKRLRSMVEVEKYLVEHPEQGGPGVKMSQFSFQTPRPLQENYVRKRPTRVKNPQSDAGLEMPAPLEPVEVNPLSWAAPPTRADLLMGGPKLFDSYVKSPIDDHHVAPPSPAKKKKKTSSKQMYYGPVYDQPKETLNTSTYDM